MVWTPSQPPVFKSAVEVVFLISQVEGDGRVQRLELELSKKKLSAWDALQS